MAHLGVEETQHGDLELILKVVDSAFPAPVAWAACQIDASFNTKVQSNKTTIVKDQR